jgi:hypothetical protein
MKNVKTYILLFVAAVGASAWSSCKKEESTPLTDLMYEVAVDGNQVTFTTVTTGVTSYQWDFGDGQTSTEANPVHIYPGKGKYVPTLTASIGGQMVESSTVLRIAKSSPVKINDNSLADWDAVTTNEVTLGSTAGVFRKVKYDYDGNYIYMYGEMASTKANGDVFDFYIDSDNNATTGYLATFKDGGYDVLLEGQLLLGGLDVFYHAGAQTGFGFEVQSISEAHNLGTVVQDGNIVKFEMRIARGKLKGLTGTATRIGIIATKSDWSATIGTAPDEGASGFLIDMND